MAQKDLKPYKKGEKRARENGRKGGKAKLGYRSLKEDIDELLSQLVITKDGKKITYQKAMLNKAIHKATIEGDIRAMEYLSNRKEGAPKATLDLSIKEPEVPIYNGKSREK